jgi:hypothetical protein
MYAFKSLNKAAELKHKMFHVEHFMFVFDRLVQALKGKDEEKEIHKSLEYGLLPIQIYSFSLKSYELIHYPLSFGRTEICSSLSC